jgi:glycine/D-amino acid oxidase-like deaminating enzyme
VTSERGRHVVVIGGGVIGLTAALALIERAPDVSVTVLERGAVGGGASRYAGALDIPYFWSPLHRHLVEVSWAWHEVHRVEGPAYRHPVPMAWYAGPHEDLSSRVVTPLSPGDLDASPAWRGPAATRRFDGPAFVIDGERWCRALARAVKRSGRGEVTEHSMAVTLEEGPATTKVVRADGRAHTAAHVVLALGPWLPSWNERAAAWAASRGVRTKRVFGLDVDVAPDARARRAVGWPSADIYFHPAPTGDRYRLSLRHDCWDVHPDEPGTMEGVVLERAGRFLDGLLGAGRWSIVGHRIFVDSYAREPAPVIARHTDLGERVTVVTATHGSGVRLAPGIGDLVARAVLGDLRGSGAGASRSEERRPSAVGTA